MGEQRWPVWSCVWLLFLCYRVRASDSMGPPGQTVTVETTRPSFHSTVATSIALQTEEETVLPSLDLLVGADLESQVASYGVRVGGLTDASRRWLLDYARQVAGSQRVMLKRRAAVVIVSPYDVRVNDDGSGYADNEGFNDFSAVAVEGALSAALESVESGDMLVLVTLGMGLCRGAAEALGELVVGVRGWGSFVALHVHEFEGYPSAINRAMVHAIPPHTITAVYTPSFQGPLPVPQHATHHGNATQETATRTYDDADEHQNDVYAAYEARRSSSPLLLTVSPPRPSSSSSSSCWSGMDMPVLVFDDTTFEALGPLDEGYMFQGGIADWVHRAQSQGWHQERDDLAHLLHSPEGLLPSWSSCRRTRPSLFESGKEGGGNALRSLRGWVTEVDVMTAAVGGDQLDKLLQQDMDTFYLARHLTAWGQCRRAAGGGCVEEGAGGGDHGHLDDGGGSMTAFHERWSGRVMTPSLVSEDWRSRLRVAAVICVYDDSTFLRELILDLTSQLDHVVVLVSNVPWNGDVRGDNNHTMGILADLMAQPRLTRDRLSVVKGRWATEGEQRQFGNALVAALPQKYTHVMVVDSDEFWHPVELQLALNLVAKQPSTVPFAAAKMWTYWKTLRTIITPPEGLNILWLVDPATCRFTRHREVDCVGGLLIYGLAKCHHLSYVRTTAELRERKLASFSHAHEVGRQWFADKWQAWDRDQSITDLHPTSPGAYKATKHQPLYLLPPTLRRTHLHHRKKRPLQEKGGEEESDRMMTFMPPRCDVSVGQQQPASSSSCVYSLSLQASCQG